MIKTMEFRGKTTEDAVAAASKELNLSEDEFSYELIERAKSGFLGIGAAPAVIRVSFEVPDEPAPAVEKKPVPEKKAPAEKKPAPEKKAPAEKKPAPAAEKKAAAAPAQSAPAKKIVPVEGEPEEYARIREFLSGLMERMGVSAEMEITARENGGINVNLSGNGIGALIGRRGETLDAIQHLTNYAVNRGSDKHMHISVDAESYRDKREESLTHLAEKMAAKAIKYKRSMALEPMNSYERHVIHTALQNYEGVTTSSTGVEPNRRVVVSYVRGENETNKPTSREWA